MIHEISNYCAGTMRQSSNGGDGRFLVGATNRRYESVHDGTHPVSCLFALYVGPRTRCLRMRASFAGRGSHGVSRVGARSRIPGARERSGRRACRRRTLPHGVAYKGDGVTDWMVPLENGRCYTFGFAADPEIERFGMYIWDPANHRVETDRGRPRTGVVEYCPKVNGMFRVEGKAMQGAGHFAVVAYAKGAPIAEAPPPPPPPPPSIDLAATIEQQAAAAAPGATRIGEYYAGTTEMSDWVTSMDAGKCYWIIGAGEPGKVKKLYLYLWNPKNSRISESKSDSDTAMVGYCAKESGHVQVPGQKVFSGHGFYKDRRIRKAISRFPLFPGER